RHTRFPRDWSSDVCSSDLDAAVLRLGGGLLEADVEAFVPARGEQGRERDLRRVPAHDEPGRLPPQELGVVRAARVEVEERPAAEGRKSVGEGRSRLGGGGW